MNEDNLYGDVNPSIDLGATKSFFHDTDTFQLPGWATAIKFNEHLRNQFANFVKRSDTFSLGVCNGCQLMSYLGWTDIEPQKSENKDQEIMLERNLSGRYESRFVSVRIEKSPSIMLSGMQESVLGVWVAHGEGQLEIMCSSSAKCSFQSKMGTNYIIFQLLAFKVKLDVGVDNGVAELFRLLRYLTNRLKSFCI